jgi:hypothetical protein
MNTRIVLNADKKYGCSICFERFDKDEKVLVCQEPCNKLFHPECFDKSIEEVSLCDIKCCYCKRTLITEENLFDRHNTFVRGLLERSSIRDLRNVVLMYTGKQAIVLQPRHGKIEQHIKMPKRGAIPPDPPRRTLYNNRGCRGRAPKGL